MIYLRWIVNASNSRQICKQLSDEAIHKIQNIIASELDGIEN